MGPSGCGKSTLLRTIAGLESISAGEIRVEGRRINDVAPRDRDIAMVFQHYALYPHMTVGANMGFALKLAGLGSQEIGRRVQSAAATLDLTRYPQRKPVALSGGQLYRKPANLFVATFIGSPQMNLVTGRLAERYRATTIGVRPEHLRVLAAGDPGGETTGDIWTGRVASAEYLGSDTFLAVDIEGAARLQVRASGSVILAAGDSVRLKPLDNEVHRFDAEGQAL